MRPLDGGVLLVRLRAGAEAALLQREIGDGREWDHRHDEVEVVAYRREQRRGESAEAHTHDADARCAAFSEPTDQRPDVHDGLAEALVCEPRIRARESRGSAM